MAKGNGTATAVKLQPLGDRVVVQPAEREETTKSGIVIPDTAKEKPQRGSVIAVGKGRRDDDGDRIPMDVSVGDCQRRRGRQIPDTICEECSGRALRLR